MNFPRCGSLNHSKDGIVFGGQRYLCKDCGYRYTVEKKPDIKSLEVRRMELDLYLKSLGFRAIGRILKISYGTVYQWIKEWGEKANLPRKKGEVQFVELDEMHT